ncbi:LysM peptidoglycan-binding domain-containing protein [Parashewanella curva]|uniref:LysM peptidoglycan-binding domain-containing protein n=1 Tax=Parashewanella curva TaxID=2338552 RepID=UPI0014047108|nr:LysM domain-containing protein [Parashewanella curva]
MIRIFVIVFAMISSVAIADTLALKQDRPQTYVVKKGDTLWDISSFYLQDPWRWPELWGANPQVSNPHLIYPGDILTLVFINGKPRLVKKPHKKLSPHGRIISKNNAIPMIDLGVIQPYIVQNRVETDQWLEGKAMVVGGERESRFHMLNDVIYIDQPLKVGQKLALYEPGRELKAHGEDLGKELVLTGSGRVIESGKVSKLKILNSLRETRAGFYALPVDEEAMMSAYYMPSPGTTNATTRVLAIANHQREAGQLNVVYLDRGQQAGIHPGQVFDIFRDGDEIVIDADGQPIQTEDRSAYDDMMASLSADNAVTVPDTFRGKLMVFKVFENVSFGLILLDDRPVRVGDKIMTPTSGAIARE